MHTRVQLIPAPGLNMPARHGCGRTKGAENRTCAPGRYRQPGRLNQKKRLAFPLHPKNLASIRHLVEGLRENRAGGR